jgi:hypothetical protein
LTGVDYALLMNKTYLNMRELGWKSTDDQKQIFNADFIMYGESRKLEQLAAKSERVCVHIVIDPATSGSCGSG